MKRLIFIFLLILCKISDAQTPFATDELGKYIIYEVVELKGVLKDSLANRAKFFLENMSKSNVQTLKSNSDSVFNASGKFVISKTSAMLSHPSGEVNYHFVAEVKDGKYRYWLTNFEYTPYQRDRYGVFGPVAGISTPLEKSPGKLNAAIWKEYVKDALDQTAKFSIAFKKQMATPLKHKQAEKQNSTISTGKW